MDDNSFDVTERDSKFELHKSFKSKAKIEEIKEVSEENNDD